VSRAVASPTQPEGEKNSGGAKYLLSYKITHNLKPNALDKAISKREKQRRDLGKHYV